MLLSFRFVLCLPLFFFLAIRADDCQYNTTDGLLDLRVFGKKSGPKYSNVRDKDAQAQRVYSFNGCFSYSTDAECKDAAACVSKCRSSSSTDFFV